MLSICTVSMAQSGQVFIASPGTRTKGYLVKVHSKWERRKGLYGMSSRPVELAREHCGCSKLERFQNRQRKLMEEKPIEQLGVENGSRLEGKCHIHVPVNTIT